MDWTILEQDDRSRWNINRRVICGLIGLGCPKQAEANSDSPNHDVEDINAVDAVLKYGDQHDILLVCWPTVTDYVLKAARLWGKEIIFIGEVTDYKLGHLGGCATDEFFDEIEIIHEFSSYEGNYIEKAMVVKCRN